MFGETETGGVVLEVGEVGEKEKERQDEKVMI